uniref:Uncharacterized protein n=1 Tax=Eutreptiella gymnastica TaxID=73025 RepID=A0A7S1NC65_9EUGL|mmetsp:Transcript_149522/g.261278  ORF Transcript_149522/g.261278 Transcript_149522/m.261278 type:complete len:338 (+) Transcript_149522:57-1070(+)
MAGAAGAVSGTKQYQSFVQSGVDFASWYKQRVREFDELQVNNAPARHFNYAKTADLRTDLRGSGMNQLAPIVQGQGSISRNQVQPTLSLSGSLNNPKAQTVTNPLVVQSSKQQAIGLLRPQGLQANQLNFRRQPLQVAQQQLVGRPNPLNFGPKRQEMEHSLEVERMERALAESRARRLQRNGSASGSRDLASAGAGSVRDRTGRTYGTIKMDDGLVNSSADRLNGTLTSHQMPSINAQPRQQRPARLESLRGRPAGEPKPGSAGAGGRDRKKEELPAVPTIGPATHPSNNPASSPSLWQRRKARVSPLEVIKQQKDHESVQEQVLLQRANTGIRRL